MRSEFEQLWVETLRSPHPSLDQFEKLADAVLDLYSSEDRGFRENIRNRSDRVTRHTGCVFDPENFDIATARAYVADEIGFTGWDELSNFVNERPDAKRPILFEYAVAAMERGDFSSLERTIGREAFHSQIVEWHETGLFENERETLDEILSAACMLGQTATAEYLIGKGVDPYAGMRTWLAGPHYAVSSGRLQTVRMLTEKGVPLEIENKYGGTMLGQALWSAINEHTEDHAEIIELLIAAGAHVSPGTLDWWEQQDVPSTVTKRRVAAALMAAQ